MTLRIPAKVLIHMWSYDFYDMTLSTRKQRCHMITLVSMKNEQKRSFHYHKILIYFGLLLIVR